MDMSRVGRADFNALPEYIISTFFPQALPILRRNPQVFKVLSLILAVYYFQPLVRLQSLWQRFAQFLVSTVEIGSEEDLFQYLVQWIADKRTFRADQTLTALTNTPVDERRRRRHDPDFEEIARKPTEVPEIKYEQSQGMQIFIHQGRLYFIQRNAGDGYTYYNNRNKRSEVLSISCLGRSSKPIKQLIESVYKLNKDKERSMTIIRRPFTGGYSSRLSWSRLTAKPRRALDTVILDPVQKQNIIKDIQEYMDVSTQNFYADHGIPYRRGYLFHGPPGCGKTSFCLALAAKFNLDVYVLTLLDHELQDSDLMSLMNQLPSPSLLLLEDIDTAGLSRKKPFASTAADGMSEMLGGISGRRRGKGRKSMPQGAVASTKTAGLESDDEDPNKQTTRVSLSGLLNAIDGVAAPEGHILIMTTNKPHELDDALVRAGRISVKVGFGNASKQQSEEIFLRMYVDQQIKGTEKHTAEDSKVKKLAKTFADKIPEGDFSPADLQDYLLLHKKEPEIAIENVSTWVEDRYQERKRKEEEKEAEIRYKLEKAERRRRQFREDMKAAFADEKKKSGEEGDVSSDEGEVGSEDEIVDERPIDEQLKEAEAEVVSEDRA